MKTSEDVEYKVKYVLDNNEQFSLYMLQKDYGIEKKSISNVRNGLRDLENLQFKTIIKLLNVYDDKTKKV